MPTRAFQGPCGCDDTATIITEVYDNTEQDEDILVILLQDGGEEYHDTTTGVAKAVCGKCKRTWLQKVVVIDQSDD